MPPFAVDGTEFSPIRLGELYDIGLATDEVTLAVLYKALDLGGLSSPADLEVHGDTKVREDEGRNGTGTGAGLGLESGTGDDGGGEGGGEDDTNAESAGGEERDDAGAGDADGDGDADDEGGGDVEDGHGEMGLGLDLGDVDHTVNTNPLIDDHQPPSPNAAASDPPPNKRETTRTIWPGLSENILVEAAANDSDDTD